MKKNLILTPTGVNSRYKEWLGENDNFDIIFLCYEDNDFYLELIKKGFKAFKVKGEKWKIIQSFLLDNKNILNHYEIFWFPDDDLSIQNESVNRLFKLHKKYNLLLSQPSATGYTSHKITNRNENNILRYTNFVEIMCPMMNKECLIKLINTFDISESGYGLDLLWPKILNYPNDKIAIIDDIEILHMNPVGSNYENRFSTSPQEELNRILNLYNLDFNLIEYNHIKHMVR